MRLDYFLGDWFIRKAIWANESCIRENAASLKKCYTYLVVIGQINVDDPAKLRKDIKTGMPEWITTARRFDSHCTPCFNATTASWLASLRN